MSPLSAPSKTPVAAAAADSVTAFAAAGDAVLAADSIAVAAGATAAAGQADHSGASCALADAKGDAPMLDAGPGEVVATAASADIGGDEKQSTQAEVEAGEVQEEGSFDALGAVQASLLTLRNVFASPSDAAAATSVAIEGTDLGDDWHGQELWLSSVFASARVW